MTFIEAKLTVKKSITLRYKIKEERNIDTSIKCDGEMEKEGSDFILIKMNNPEKTEFVLFRLYTSLPKTDMLLYGLQLSLSENRHPYSGALIMTKEPKTLSENEFKEFIKKKYKHTEEKRMLTVNH